MVQSLTPVPPAEDVVANVAKNVDEGFEVPEVDISDLVIEDDIPVDNMFSEKQQRLLTEPLYSSWIRPGNETGEPGLFLAAANVGLFVSPHLPPLVPDVFLSLDVRSGDLSQKKNRTYLYWEFGK